MASKSRIGGLPQFDWVLLVSYLALVGIGLMMLYATTYYDSDGAAMFSVSSEFGRQLMWAVISLGLLLLAYFIDWQFLNTISLPLYLLGIVSLVVLLVIGTEVKGATSWIRFGPFSIQPSEFAKITTSIYLASILSAIRFDLRQMRTQLFVFGVIALPAALIMLQPDPGSALTFFSLLILLYRRGLPAVFYITMIALFLTLVLSLIYGFYLASSLVFLLSLLVLFNFNRSRLTAVLIIITLALATILAYQYGYAWMALALNAAVAIGTLFFYNKKKLFSEKISLLVGLAVLCGLSYSSDYAFNNILKPHQQDRINVWLQPEKCDPRGSLYNLIQSKLAIGSGGVTGKGYLNGTFTKLNYVPEQTTDFIFSSIGEEQGFLGSLAVIALFLIMVMRLVQRGEDASSLFVTNYSYAIAGFIFVHFFINIGMTIGISPVIGIPLPFISKGGSALMAFSIMIGLALRMYRSR